MAETITPSGAVRPTLYCSFCGKGAYEVTRLIAGPTAFICNECVDLCNVIIAEKTPAGGALEAPIAERGQGNVLSEKPSK